MPLLDPPPPVPSSYHTRLPMATICTRPKSTVGSWVVPVLLSTELLPSAPVYPAVGVIGLERSVPVVVQVTPLSSWSTLLAGLAEVAMLVLPV